MNKITVSAPGKLMLFGEHAVLYDYPCIVTSVNQRMKVTVELTNESVFQLEAPDVQITSYQKSMSQLGKGEIPKGAKFVEVAVRNFLTKHHVTLSKAKGIYSSASPQNDKFGVKVTTASEFSSQFGFGSSSASTVCVIKALSELTDKKLSNKQIFDLAYKTVLDIQGKGSGFDVAAAVFGGTLYFIRAGKVITPLKIGHLPIIVGYSGIKFDTVKLIDEVAIKAKKYPKLINNVYEQIGIFVDRAKQALLKSDFQTLGELMNFNQGYLSILGVSSQKLDNMINSAKFAGAYGAKLSGAGGGDCMIALSPPSKVKAVKQAIKRAGGKIIEVKTKVEGVRVESRV